MTFTEWILNETRMTWKQLQQQGTTTQQRYRLFEDYEEYCNVKGIEKNFDFRNGR